jgi:hypothetical protein
MLDPNENPYVFHPAAFWAMAIFCLIAPLPSLFLGRWWAIHGHAIPIVVCWLIALVAFTAGLGSLRWRHRRGGKGRSSAFAANFTDDRDSGLSARRPSVTNSMPVEPRGRLILTVLGGLAEFERHLIVARTGDGRKRARARGVLFGRPPKLTPHQRREAIARRDAGETLMNIARSYNVSHSTISRL